MNDRRRKKVERIANKVMAAHQLLEYVREDEQEAFDNMPESIQFSTKGGQMEETLDLLDDVLAGFADGVTNLLTDIVGED